MIGNALGAVNRMRTTPVPVQRTTRTLQQRVLTSLPAGKMVPLLAIPLLREDSANGSLRIAFEMDETVEVLMNAVNVRVMAYLVPRLAFERYDGLDSLNKSYEGVPLVEGGPVTPWFELNAATAPGTNEILFYMGKHARTGQMITTDYVEAYNQIWNFRAKNRSKDIALRTRLQTDLAPGFWTHQTFAHVVPDFDQAIIDGEVPLSITPGTQSYANVQMDSTNGAFAGVQQKSSGNLYGLSAASQMVLLDTSVPISSPNNLRVDMAAAFAELAEEGITVSLSNIELARKTQAFANLRRQYQGHSDEYIINLLMDGITLPDEQWKQPLLLADETTVFGMSKRYATDAANLTESVVNGLTFVDLRLNCPRVGPGGVIMVVAEISPEQLFERQKDPYLHAQNVEDVPQFLRDTLDPEKVVVVQNEEVDLDHETPTATFGYAPLNHEWARSMPQIGGKFFRPTVDAAFDEDRQRIWAVETQNPVLSEDFYLVTTMHYKPFVVTDLSIDPFEALVRGAVSIRGNTVFGGLLVEATSDYEDVMAQAPMDRIDKPDPAATDAPDVSP